jgi:hypothetical protein
MAKVEPDAQGQPDDQNDGQGHEHQESGVARRIRAYPGGECKHSGHGQEENQKRQEDRAHP